MTAAAACSLICFSGGVAVGALVIWLAFHRVVLRERSEARGAVADRLAAQKKLDLERAKTRELEREVERLRPAAAWSRVVRSYGDPRR